MVDPNRWQPLFFRGDRFDQFGQRINESTQRHLTPFWGQVRPFAITEADRSPNGVYHDQGAPRQLGGATDAAFKQIDALTVIRLASQLDPSDGVMIDISPASRGNTPDAPFTESYDQVGYAVNPFTNQPYPPHMVKRGDFAQLWPSSGPTVLARPPRRDTGMKLPTMLSDQMDALGIPKRIGGTGPVVNDLEWDVKKYFALNAGMHDAAIAAWNHKGVYDSARPISFVRYMGQLGQSSDPGLMADIGGGVMVSTYHPQGLPLEPGLVEVITAQYDCARRPARAPGWPRGQDRHSLLARCHRGHRAVRRSIGNQRRRLDYRR